MASISLVATSERLSALTFTLASPLRPHWIQHVLAFWRSGQPPDDLADTLPGPPAVDARRQVVLTIVSRFLSAMEPAEPQRAAAGNLWPVYSRAYPPSTLAPTYLAHLIAQEPLLQTVARAIAGPHAPGHRFTVDPIARRVGAQHGHRAGATAAVLSCLQTLQAFGVVVPDDALGAYRYATRLIVDQPVFPLLVWSWWQTHHSAAVELERFAGHTAFLFLHTGDFDIYWRSFDGRRWSLDGPPARHATLPWSTSG